MAGLVVLITGGRGYVASAIVRQLARVACVVRRVLRPGVEAPRVAGGARVEDVWGDLDSASFWLEIVAGADVVLHLAGQTSAYIANAEPARDLTVNVLPMLHLLGACRGRARAPAVVFAGTVTQVGVPARLPVSEDGPDAPVTVYDLHKLMAEQYLKYYSRLGVVHGVSLRLANVYGPGPASSSADRGVLNLMMRRALKGEALTVYGDGARLRDYVHVDDVARAFLTAASQAQQLSGRHFVIGSGVGTSIGAALNLVADQAAAHTGRRAPVVRVDPPASLSPVEGRDFIADITAFATTTGWRPRYTLAQGIDHTLSELLSGGAGAG